MKNSFDIRKNGKVANNCFVHVEKKIVVPANSTGYGFNFQYDKELTYGEQALFHNIFGFNLKTSWSKGRNITPSYSQKTMEELGFVLVKSGSNPLF